MLGGGDVNLYSLFVERAQALVDPNGLVALLTPSGIAADKGAARFFRSISTTGRLGALLDFENRDNSGGSFFADVDSRFKFCVILFCGAHRSFAQTRCAFYLHQLEELDAPERTLLLTAEDFALVNPNTGAAPIFRTRRDADITTGIYRANPVLVKRNELNKATNQRSERKAWPVKYVRMFDMTNDSKLFLTAAELTQLGFARAPLNRWRKGDDEALPLYEGKMVQMFDHRAADVVMNNANLKRPAQQQAIEPVLKERADRFPTPQFFVAEAEVVKTWGGDWALAYKSITSPTNMRTMIAAIVPKCGLGNSMAALLPNGSSPDSGARASAILLANLNALSFDFALRQKVQGQNLNWFVVEQAAVITAERFDQALPARFAAHQRAAGLMNGYHPQPTVADFIRPAARWRAAKRAGSGWSKRSRAMNGSCSRMNQFRLVLCTFCRATKSNTIEQRFARSSGVARA